MALRHTLTKRLLNNLKRSSISSPIIGKTLAPPNSGEMKLRREFVERRGINYAARLPEFLSLPVGDKLREKLRSMNISGDRIRLDGIAPRLPEFEPAPAPVETIGRLSVSDARKVLRYWQLEKVRMRLSEIPMNSISHSNFVEICSEVCGNGKQGLEFAKMLDDSGSVIVLGNLVLLRPYQVAKSMDKIISESIVLPNDTRRKELEVMEKQKEAIDEKAQSLVKAELYCGLGYLVLQTLGFMRLTFWELSWDVMEPICFFVTSLHFALAYVFFIRTSKEPCFEGYFNRRFQVKQKKLMKIQKFDIERYNQLRQAFYPLASTRIQDF